MPAINQHFELAVSFRECVWPVPIAQEMAKKTGLDATGKDTIVEHIHEQQDIYE
jgi:hypothetical protein